jgi:hypothetical protein
MKKKLVSNNGHVKVVGKKIVAIIHKNEIQIHQQVFN